MRAKQCCYRLIAESTHTDNIVMMFEAAQSMFSSVRTTANPERATRGWLDHVSRGAPCQQPLHAAANLIVQDFGYSASDCCRFGIGRPVLHNRALTEATVSNPQ